MKSSPVHLLIETPCLSEKELSLLSEQVKSWSVSKKLSAFALGAKRLPAVLKRFPKGMWDISVKKGNWNITQILWHLADQEANHYVRQRRGVAEPGQAVSAYDQENGIRACSINNRTRCKPGT